MNKTLSSIRNVGGGAFGWAAVAVLALALVSADVLAQPSHVFVDGQLMSDAQLAGLERMNRAAIPDDAYGVVAFCNGNGYWVDTRR